MSNSPIIVALDYSNKKKALDFVSQISPQHCRLKIGKETFTYFGPEFVKELQHKGFDVFLDLKFYDIPNTVAKAIRAAADLGVWMINVHACGGARMMDAAKEILISYGNNAPKLIAVTVLTSVKMDELQQVGVNLSMIEYVKKLALLTHQCGLDGVICSAQETVQLKRQFGAKFSVITPGIRPEGCGLNDQQRTMTPQQAIAAGVDYIVLGRPITQAKDPVSTLKNILSSINY